MGNYNDNRRSGGGNRGGFGGGGRGGRGGFGGGGGRGGSEMHEATCSDCGKRCEVPFRPSGGKPVYCNDCFKRDDDGGGRSNRSGDRRGGGRDFGRPSMHQATCAACGNKCEVPFRPTSDKPVYCNDCFGESKGRGGDFGSKKSGQSEEQHEQLNKKLDKILRILETISPKKTFTVSKSDLEELSEENNDVKPAKKTAKKKVAKKKAPAKKKAAKKKGKKAK